MLDILNQADRMKIIRSIKSDENQKRMAQSLAELEIYNDNITPYVDKYLSRYYDPQTLKENPVISCINICRRVVNQEASIYKESPERTFLGVSEEQAEFLTKLYNELGVDSKMLKSNQYYKLQRQNHISPIVAGNKLHLRVLANHHINVVPNEDMPEMADIFVISGFDKGPNGYNPQLNPYADNINQTVADTEDYKSKVERYAFWTKDYNFICDGAGNIISGVEAKQVENGLKLVPIVEVSDQKDLEYWQRQGSAIAEFTVQFNGALTDLSQIVRMQGFSIAYMKGPKGMAAQDTVIGLNRLLKLEIDPNNPVETEFGFASPSPDLAGSIQYVEMLLSSFLSSRGIDPKTISGKGEAKAFSSGVERLLAMLDKFEASRTDIAVYERAEVALFEVIKSMLNTYVPVGLLDYKVSAIPESATVSVKYNKPEMIQTEADKIASIEKKLELGLIGPIEAIAMDREIPLDEAELVYRDMLNNMAIQPNRELQG